MLAATEIQQEAAKTFFPQVFHIPKQG